VNDLESIPSATSSDCQASLDAILLTDELWRRPGRPADYRAECRALSKLVQALADDPTTILQALAETVLTEIGADSAGLSLLTDDGSRFYWAAIAGAWRPHVGEGTPRHFGPCGDVLDAGKPLLFTHWERRYPYLSAATPLAEEGLLAPFSVAGRAVGTIWAIHHTDQRQFDAESLRLLQSMGKFAAAAYQAVAIQTDLSALKRVEARLARRAEEQAALYQFTERLQHLARLEDLYEPALDAMFRALVCDRASVLLFDASGVMRFVASRGLSDAYRAAVDGHSPWGPGDVDASPISVPDVETSGLSDALKKVVRSEGIRALSFVPIAAGGKVLGKFMTYYDRPHVFAPAEVDLALTVARQLAFSVLRIRADEARQRTERAAQQLVAIVESSHDAIVSKDLNGIIQTWNAGAEHIFGYAAEEVVGKSITIIIPPDRLDEEPQILARLRAGERVDHFETVRRRKDGGLIDVSLTISPVRDFSGKIIGASKIARDITERKEADAKLKASEQQLKDLLSAIPAAIYTTDAAGKITYFNDAAVELAGRTPTIGSDEWCVTWKLYNPDGSRLPHDQCPMAVALKEGRPIRNAEAIAERPDGTRVPFIPYPTPLRDSKGRVVGAVNMLVDISERRQAESQQRLLFNELNHRVKNNMQMLQSLLHMSVSRTASSEARKVLSDASNRVAAMASAQQVLYGTTDAKRFNAAELVQAVSQTVQHIFPQAVKVACDVCDDAISNEFAMPLALILNELLTNALKHGGARGQRIVTVQLHRRGDGFQLAVEDEGPGFDLHEVLPHSSGLQLVNRLIRQLRGAFEVVRSPRCRCVVTFPGAAS
jgi:PAS domain S-box-containing protein